MEVAVATADRGDGDAGDAGDGGGDTVTAVITA